MLRVPRLLPAGGPACHFPGGRRPDDLFAEKAERVLRSIPAKLGTDALYCVELSFLSCMEEKDLAILAFLRLGYQKGSAVMRMLTEPCVHSVITAARSVSGEAHLFKGFVRFSEYGGALAAEITPKNHVLPLLGRHFQLRMPEQSFLIFDRSRRLALVCSGGQSMILPMEQAQLPAPSERELFYRRLLLQTLQQPLIVLFLGQLRSISNVLLRSPLYQRLRRMRTVRFHHLHSLQQTLLHQH